LIGCVGHVVDSWRGATAASSIEQVLCQTPLSAFYRIYSRSCENGTRRKHRAAPRNPPKN